MSVDEREAIFHQAIGWLAWSVGAEHLKAQAELAEETGEPLIADQLRRWAELVADT